MRRRLTALLLPLAVTAAACTDSSASADATRVEVTSTDDECRLGATSVPSGPVVFDVHNTGGKVTEFYLLAADGLRIVGEVENVGPGITRSLVVRVGPGSYVAACKPGMVGDGIRTPLAVTDSGADVAGDADREALLTTATDRYEAYVRDQTAQLVTQTERFAALVTAADDAAARALYPVARTHWERIEPVAESFGDLDPRLDLREADLETGQAWTGWHRLEKELWPPAVGYTPLTAAERAALATQLVDDTLELARRVTELALDPAQLGNGAKELLDEVATGKVTGEEEFWSHTDLWDVQANVDGARIAFEALEPVLRRTDAALADRLTARFAALQALLDTHRRGDGFVGYDELTAAQVTELASTVDALGEPLAGLTAAVVL